MLNERGRYQAMQLNPKFRGKMYICIYIQWEIIKNAYLCIVELCRILIYFCIFCSLKFSPMSITFIIPQRKFSRPINKKTFRPGFTINKLSDLLEVI